MLAQDLSIHEKKVLLASAQYAEGDLLLFCKLLTPDPTDPINPRKSQYTWLPVHKLLCQRLQAVESGKIQYLEIETPPRIGKSQTTVRSFVPWIVGKHPTEDLIVITATDELAQQHGRDVRDYMRGPGYRLVFGHDVRTHLREDGQSTTLLQVKGGGKIIFTGRGGLTAGVGAHRMIFDDFFKSSEEANSPTTRDSAHRCFVADCQSRLNSSKASIVVIGSRKHEDDVQGRLFDPMNVHYDDKEAKKWVRIRLPALAEANDILGRAVDEPLWPDRFSFDHYNSKRNHASPVVRIDFQTQDQCKPTPEEGNYFKAEWLKTWRPGGKVDLPDKRFLRFYCASDHALRAKQKNDSTVLLCVAIDPTDRIFVLPDTVWDKLAPDVMVERMIDLMAKYQTDMWWAARDQISGSIEPFLKKRMRERGVFRPWDDSLSESVDLIQRARSIQARMAMGMVYWPSHWEKWGEAESQLKAFDNGAHDDIVAALAMLGMGLDRMITNPGAKPSNMPVKGSWDYHQYGRNQPETKSTTAWV